MKDALLFFIGLVLSVAAAKYLDVWFGIDWIRTLVSIDLIAVTIWLVCMYRGFDVDDNLYFRLVILPFFYIGLFPFFSEKISEAMGVAAIDCRGEYENGHEMMLVTGQGENKVAIAAGGQTFPAKVIGNSLFLENGDTLFIKVTSRSNPDTTEHENTVRSKVVHGRLATRQVKWESAIKVHEPPEDPAYIVPCTDF